MNGFWTASFNTPMGLGYGVAFFTDTQVFGGDSAFTYVGNYESDSSIVTAQLQVNPFNNSMGSVFGSNQAFTLTITGKVQAGQLKGQGSASHAPGIPFEVTLTKVK